MSGRKSFSKNMKKKSNDIVFDDSDSDDSDSNDIELFNKKMSSQIKKQSSDDDESNDEIESDEDSESSDDSDNNTHPTKKDAERKAKLAHLQASLKGIKSTKTEESSSEDEEDNESLQESSENEKDNSEENISENNGEDDDDESDEITSNIKNSEKTSVKKRKMDEDNEETERKKIRSELSQMSIEEIQKLKEKIGLKMYNQALGLEKKKNAKNFVRENKNRPREMSSKKTVSRFREVVPVSFENKLERRDPRFDSACGEFDEKLFKESYKFVDDIKINERKKLAQQLEIETDEEEIRKIKYLIQRFDNQVREKKKVEERKHLEAEEKLKNRTLIKEGKKPEFVSKSEKKNRDLVEKYELLKKSGNLDKYLKKKEKKNLAKDRRKNTNIAI